ncbi:endonuclease I [Rhodobacterales bacterium]|nr:endonuclease I [Rhodobacterales bacterium]
MCIRDRPRASTMPASLDTQLEKSIAQIIEEASKDEGYYESDRDREDIRKYYESIEHDTGEVRLYHEYSRVVTKTHARVFGYDSARLKVLYPYVDQHKDGALRSIYSGELMSPAEVMMEEALILMERLPKSRESFMDLGLDGVLALSDGLEDLLPEDEAMTVPYNCEHIVPQSWYEKRKPMVSDLHHLFTCERKCNSYRGNRPYGDHPDFEPDPLQIDLIEAELRKKCGLVEETENGMTAFEPEQNKGVVARATLYFLLRYRNEVGNAQGEMPLETVETLLKWHAEQPVSDYERHRNRAVFLTQGNRNPFIDFPDLADKVGFRESFA